MAVSTLLSQARAGHAAAIAQLMNQQLQSRGVNVQAIREGNCLSLLLEGDSLLTQAGFVAYVEQAMGRLGCPVIEWVKMTAVDRGSPQPLWQSSVVLADVTATFPQRELAVVEAVGQGLGQAGGQGLGQGGTRQKPVLATPSNPVGFQAPGPLAPQEDHFEADVAALTASASQGVAGSTTPETWRYRGGSVEEPETTKRLPMPSRGIIARQWFTASLLGTLATVGITAAISVLLIPIVASMTGMEQLSGFAVVILLAMQFIIGIPLAGLLIGYAQTRMLRRYLRTVGGWQLITPLGCLMGFFIAVIVHFVGQSTLSLTGWANSLGQAENLTGQLLSLGCTTLGVGLGFSFLGLAQFAVLTGRMRRAQHWIGVTGLSGMAAWLVGGSLFKLILPSLDGLARMVNMTPMLLGGILAAIAAWLVFQSLSAVFLAVLLKPQGSGTGNRTGSGTRRN